jgi:hypothetical protein
MSGFGKSNLWSTAQFYTEYHNDTNLQPMVGEISWSKHLVIHKNTPKVFVQLLGCSSLLSLGKVKTSFASALA